MLLSPVLISNPSSFVRSSAHSAYSAYNFCSLAIDASALAFISPNACKTFSTGVTCILLAVADANTANSNHADIAVFISAGLAGIHPK